ncbi:MAG: leucine-rich repeat protein [Clostridia bacterium]|nr:leucine-rich repeat protein [Clostridia bacterium]
MKKFFVFKRVFAIIVIVSLLLTSAPLHEIVKFDMFMPFSFTAKAEDYPLSVTGQCGENAYWNFDNSTGELTITGTGMLGIYHNYSWYSCFSWNSEIKSVIIENGITGLCERAFYDCENLETVTLPDTISEIGDAAFEDCIKLKSINLPNLTVIPDSVFSGCKSLLYIDIPDSVKEIHSYAFSDCEQLKNIYLPDNIESIYDGAFYHCKAVRNIFIPQNVSFIESSLFSGCDSLTSIIIDAENPFYDSRNNCNAIIETSTNTLICGCKNTIIPDSVTSIGEYAFSHYTSSINIIIPNGVTCIERGAFEDCTGLTSITIPDSITEIYDSPFAGCENINEIHIGAGLVDYQTDIFRDTQYYNNDTNWENGYLYIDNRLIDIKMEELSDTIEIKNGTISLPGQLYDCQFDANKIKRIILPESLESISSYCFEGFENVNELNIPKNVKYIGESAFWAFKGSINVDSANSFFSSENGILYDKNKTQLIFFPKLSELTEYEIPSSVCNIKSNPFWWNDYLCKIIVSPNLKTIATQSFGGIRNLEIAVFRDGVEYIDYHAFEECENLTTIYLPKSIKSIDTGAFYCMDGKNCNTSLTDVYYEGTEEEWQATGIDFDWYGTYEPIIIHYNSSYDETNDTTNPTGSISSTNNVAASQTVTLSLSDNVGVAGYYWGTSSTYSNNTYTATSSSSVNKTMSSSGTYYLTVKDTSGNVSSNYSITFYKTTLNANGGSVSPTSVLTKSGNTFTFPTPTRSGYTYSGWSTSGTATSGVTTLKPTSNSTYYAVWTQNDTTKPTGSISSTNNVAASQTVTLSLSDNVGVAGYYWGTSSTYSNNTYTATSSSSVNKTMSSSGTYYLTVKDTSGNVSSNYSITFYKTTLNANGGSVSPTSVLTKSNNTFSFPTPTKSGYTYSGWSTSSTATSGVTTLKPTSNSTYYAVWQSTVNIYNLGEETYSFDNYGDSDSPGGHCFGMAVTSSGYYLGTLSKSIINGNDSTALYSFKDTSVVRKPICYYLQIQGPGAEQDSMVAGGSIDLTGYINTESDWNSCVNYVKNHQFDNTGKLNVGMWFAYSGGHAVNFLYYKEVNGQQRIYVYDNNFPETETYYYLASDGYIHQAPYETSYQGIIGMDLMDVDSYFELAPEFKRNRYIYADKNEIVVEGASVYNMKCSGEYSDYVMFEIPENVNEVSIKPLKNDASFTYFDETYSFNEIDTKTYGTLKVKTKDSSPSIEDDFQIINEPDAAKINLPKNVTMDYKAELHLDRKYTNMELLKNCSVSFTSSNPEVAEVDGYGNVTSHKVGQTVITCKVINPNGNVYEDSCTVKVRYNFFQWILNLFMFGWLWY